MNNQNRNDKSRSTSASTKDQKSSRIGQSQPTEAQRGRQSSSDQATRESQKSNQGPNSGKKNSFHEQDDE